MRNVRRALTAAAAAMLFTVSSGAAAAAEIKLVSVGALQIALRAFAADFQASSGHTIAFTFTNPTNLNMVLAGGTFDSIIVATSSVGDLEQAGRLVPGSRMRIARTGIALAIKEGTPKPDVSTPDAFKRYMTQVRNVLLTDPTTVNGSGVLTRRILSDAGLTDIVLAKSMQTNIAGGRELLIKGEYAVALFNLSETEAPGVVVGGAVPAPFQQYTNYDAAVFANSPAKDAATAFNRFLASPAANAKWKAAWLEPVSN